ncbi:hypothetical protein SEVIR_9G396951v4 [Setaria viridis]
MQTRTEKQQGRAICAPAPRGHPVRRRPTLRPRPGVRPWDGVDGGTPQRIPARESGRGGRWDPGSSRQARAAYPGAGGPLSWQTTTDRGRRLAWPPLGRVGSRRWLVAGTGGRVPDADGWRQSVTGRCDVLRETPRGCSLSQVGTDTPLEKRDQVEEAIG